MTVIVPLTCTASISPNFPAYDSLPQSGKYRHPEQSVAYTSEELHAKAAKPVEFSLRLEIHDTDVDDWTTKEIEDAISADLTSIALGWMRRGVPGGPQAFRDTSVTGEEEEGQYGDDGRFVVDSVSVSVGEPTVDPSEQ